MKKLKHLLLTMILATFMIQPAMAGVLNDDDMAFAFGSPGVSSDLGEMALLSHQEMVATEGEWWPVLYYGFYGGYYGARALSIYSSYYYGVWAPAVYRHGSRNRWW